MLAQLNSLDWLILGLIVLFGVGLIWFIREDSRAWKQYLEHQDRESELRLRRRNHLE